jgi:hypothetical protein
VGRLRELGAVFSLGWNVAVRPPWYAHASLNGAALPARCMSPIDSWYTTPSSFMAGSSDPRSWTTTMDLGLLRSRLAAALAPHDEVELALLFGSRAARRDRLRMSMSP